MKIAYITLSVAYNYGAVLQAYAFYTYLTDRGHDVWLIDYIPERYNISDKNYVRNCSPRWGKIWITRLLYKAIKLSSLYTMRNHFGSFVRENIRTTSTYYNEKEFLEKPIDADLFVTGSDQIWNSDFSWNKMPDGPYFLSFLVDDKIPRVSYASSFGKNYLNETEALLVQGYLKKFMALGVREQSGIKICEKLGLDAQNVVDPTLLCDSVFWKNKACKRLINNNYLLVFLLRNNKEILSVARQYAKKKKLEMVVVLPIPQKIFISSCKKIYLPTVEEWLSYFAYSDFVITDSYHGTVFSTHFEKQFVVVPRGKYITRISDYLDRLGISERAIPYTDLKRTGLIDDVIDYKLVREKKDFFIKESKSWLNAWLEKVKNSNAI